MELTFLGTSAGVPTRTRNMTSIILNLQQPTRAEMWLFDCGEGTQHQFLRTPYHPGKLNKIFITHLHGDHLFGLPGLLCSRSMQGNSLPLTLYGPKGLKEFVETALRLSGSWTDYPLHHRSRPWSGVRRRGLSGHRVPAQPSGGVLRVSH